MINRKLVYAAPDFAFFGDPVSFGDRGTHIIIVLYSSA